MLLSSAGVFLRTAKSLTNFYGVAIIEDVQPGYYQVRTSRIGYYTLNEDLKIPTTTEKHIMIHQDMVISPRLSLRGTDDMYRIVLTWGRQPKDLDSYLITPWPGSSDDPDCESGMVYYDGKRCQQGSEIIDLDVDATDMYGPETITMRGLQSETFAYYVHIYTNDVCWNKISANVKIYQASTGGLLHSIQQPDCSENGLGYDSSNCSRFWHVFDFDASTAKFKIYQNRLMSTVPTLPVKSIVNPNCSCTIKHEISSNDVISSAEKISTTAKNLMVDKLCVNEMKNIYDNATKKNIRLNPSDLVDRLAKFISGRIEEKRQLGMKLKSVIEKDYEEYKTVNEHRITNLKEIAPKQCCRYDGHTRYSTEFQRWVNTRSSCWSWPSEIKEIPDELVSAYDWTSSLETQMMENLHSGSQKGQLKWQYFADDTTGFFRKFPAALVGSSQCATKDERLQPWYIASILRPKNVVILFDISYSMTEDNKIIFARTAITPVLKGLLPTDFVNVIAFAESALLPGMTHSGVSDGTYSGCFNTQLVQANGQNLRDLKRFVQDVPLAFTKTSNYYNAISMALKLLTDIKNNRDTHLIFLAGSTDVSTEDISALLSRSNTTVSVYTYSLMGESVNSSSDAKKKRSVQRLKKMAQTTNGKFESITNYRELAFRMGRFYKNIRSQSTQDRGPRLSYPQFAERLGMYVTLGVPCYSKDESLIGVVGIDIVLSELLQNTVSFGPGELSYTFVIETNTGQALVHPQLPEPEEIQEDPVVIMISDMETSPGFSDVLSSMMKRETGSKTLRSERVLSRGDPNFNGYRGVTTDFTYSWKPVNNTNFAVCIVIASDELDTKEIVSHKPYPQPDLYHRYDFVKDLKVGSIIEDKPIAFLSNTSFPATLSRSNYFLSSSCFKDPYMFENTPETFDFVRHLSDYVDGLTDRPPTPSLVKGVLVDIRLTREIEKCWNRNPMRVLGSSAAWRYIATNSGAMRQYPGRQTYNNRYDPTTRPWYYAAKSYPGKVTFSVPYLDNGGAGVVVTTSQTISSDSMVRAVMGIDFKMIKIHEIVSDSGEICKMSSVFCMLIDPNGYVVYTKQFMSHPRIASERVHLAYKHPELLLDLMKKGIISTSLACNDLELGQTYTNYKITDTLPSGKVHGKLNCGAYTMVAVPNTNVYLVVLDGGDCPDSAIKCTSCSKKSCADGITKEGSLSAPICVPCLCSVPYSPCALHYYKSPNAAVACPSMRRSLAPPKIACKKPDTDSVFIRVPIRNPGLGSTTSPNSKHPSGTGAKLTSSLLSLWFVIVLSIWRLSEFL
ncbi:VWFA and cache domain-containing protein 1-like [Porites lutea]|uniref:VWFA and cache domain-containing protein 1-like n=1 Tax=Porites lutea TaxID=51062 RepID=UPI003CC5274B